MLLDSQDLHRSGNIPTWLNSQSALIRDWLGYHQVGKADVRAFRGAISTGPKTRHA